MQSRLRYRFIRWVSPVATADALRRFLDLGNRGSERTLIAPKQWLSGADSTVGTLLHGVSDWKGAQCRSKPGGENPVITDLRTLDVVPVIITLENPSNTRPLMPYKGDYVNSPHSVREIRHFLGPGLRCLLAGAGQSVQGWWPSSPSTSTGPGLAPTVGRLGTSGRRAAGHRDAIPVDFGAPHSHVPPKIKIPGLGFRSGFSLCSDANGMYAS